ncbi:MAG: hypothetical protein QM753_16890 [Thermomicrobiales bacterium]
MPGRPDQRSDPRTLALFWLQGFGYDDEHADRHDHAQGRHRPEGHPPVRDGKDAGPDDRTEDRGKASNRRDDIQDADQARPLRQVDDHGTGDHHRPAATEALHQPSCHQQFDA